MKKCFSLFLSLILVALSILSAPFSVSASEQSTESVEAISDILFGDVNGDNTIDNNDVIWVKSYRDDVISFTEEQKVLADVDGNGQVDAEDQSIIREVAEGRDTNSMPIYDMLLDAGFCGVNLYGDNVKYLLNTDGTLIIFGEGEMFNNLSEYSDLALEYVPWYSNRSSVKTVEIKNGVTSIGKRVFEKSPNLTSVVIPDSVTEINRNAFAYCKNLTDIILPENITILDIGVFQSCTSLTSITVPDSVTSIGEYAFYNCQSLTNVRLPERLSRIAYACFYGCTGLVNISLPDSLTEIGDDAFMECTSLTGITIPKNVTSIGGRAFSNCSNLESIIVDSHNTIFDSRNNCNAIIKTAESMLRFGCKNTVIPQGIDCLGSYAFYGCSGLTGITIPDGVMIIGDSAFCNCANLHAITLPDSLTTIYDGAFQNCQNLKSVHIPSRVTEIGEYNNPFSGCSGLIDITVDEKNVVYDSRDNCNAIVETASNSIIAGCKTTVIPDTVTSIFCYAFSYNTELTGIVIPDSITEIGYSAFEGCTNLIGIVIPSSVTHISDFTFANCRSLTSIAFDVNLTSVHRYAFESCTKLTDAYYSGTQEQWNTINFSIGNDSLKNAYIHFNSSIETINCDLLGVQHTWNTTRHIPPTCTVDGREEYICMKCSATKSVTLHATGHVKGQWETVEEPSETEEGLRVKKCTVCGTMLESETIPLLVPQASGKIIAESVTGRIGETVDVNISIRDNPGITSLQLKVGYSADDLELTQIIDNSLFDSSISHSKLTNNPVKISWFSSLSDDNDENGVLATLRFRIKSGAKDSTVMLSYDQPNIFNISGQEISFNTYAGTVSVDNTKVLSSIAVSEMPTKTVYEIGESLDTTGLQLKLIYSDGSVSYATSGFTTGGFSSASEGAKMVTVHYQDKTVSFEVTVNPHAEQPTYSDKSPRFIIGSSTGKPDETVDIKVSIENNPAITALQVKIGYSSEDLELIEIKDDYLFGSPISGSKYLTDNPQIISWFSRDSEDHIENGTIATLRFKIKPNAKDSNITLSFKKSNIFNSNFEEFDFQTVNGTVYVTQSAILFGDVDNDGDIEIRDATWIQRHVALMEIPIAVHKAIADVDSDGEITLMDATLIQRYLANLKSNDKIGKLLAG